MSLTITLQSALSGLLAAQRGLDLVSQNVANVNTEGYTRKIAKQETLAVAGDSIGVQVGPSHREVDEALLRTLLNENGLLSKLQSDSRLFTHTQQLFGAPGDESTISHAVNKLNQTLETLATQPSQPGGQAMAVQAAVDFADQLGHLSDGVQKLRAEADRDITDALARINNNLKIIEDLNITIARNSATQRETADLEDKRDAAMHKLAELIDITYYRQSDGTVVIYTGGGRVLLDREAKELTHIAAGKVDGQMAYESGNFDAIQLGDNDITNEIRSGELKSLIEMRDKVLPDLQAETDALAARLREEVNLAHNRATGYPQLAQNLDGTRQFVDTANQTLSFTNGTDDVAFVMYDDAGDESDSTTLRAALTADGWNGTDPFSVDDVAAALNTWFTANGIGASASTADGNLAISVSDNSLGFGMRDLPGGGAPGNGETPGDITFDFDADGDGTADETVRGFSNFFGLNDLFVDGRPTDTWDSEIKSKGFSASVGNLRIADAGGNSTTIAVAAGASLDAIAAQINAQTDVDVRASVVPEGAGWRLRITHATNGELSVTGPAASNLGFAASANGAAFNLDVRDDIVADPGRLGRAVLQHNGTGYFVSEGDNTGVIGMTEALSNKHQFDNAGRVSRGAYSLPEFAATVISLNSGAASASEDRLQYQQSLTTDLKHQRDSEAGVNLDEEMSAMLVFQQAYGASARIITATQRMFEILENIR